MTLLEIQMDEVQGDVSQNEGDIALLFTHQIIQDERLVDLEDDTSNLEQSVESQYPLRSFYFLRKKPHFVVKFKCKFFA